MDTFTNVTARVPDERAHGRPGTWLAVGLVATGLAAVAWLVDSAPVAIGALGIGGACVTVAVLIHVRRIRIGHDELIAGIDANLAAREADPPNDDLEYLRQREAVLRFRDRLAGRRRRPRR